MLCRILATALIATVLVGAATQNEPRLSEGSRASRTVYVISLSGDVEPTMAAFLSRALKETSKEPDALVVIEMDTFGGRVDAALQIVDTLLFVKSGPKIAFVKTKAISAGALIALACDQLVMKRGSTIGDCEPITYSAEGPQKLGEKFQSPLRAKFRALAQRNGFPPTLAEAMVSSDMLIYRVELPDTTMYLDSIAYAELSPNIRARVVNKKTVLPRGRLLTMNDDEAREFGFSKMSVDSVPEMLTAMGIVSPRIIRIKKNWSERLVHFLAMIAPFLMAIGFACLYIEYKTPGFGIFGIIGILCLALVFFGQYMVGLGSYTELLLLVLGVVLLGVELFVLPGFGIAGILGIACLLLGMILSMQNFVIPTPSMPWQTDIMLRNALVVIGSFVFAFIAALITVRFVLPGLGGVVQGPYLSATLEDSHVDSEAVKAVQPGKEGIVITPLRPAGKVRIGNETYDVVTEAEFIEAGQNVVVSKIKGNSIIVEKKRDA